MRQRTPEDYYRESKRIREEVLQQAELLKGNPLHFTITNGITMRVESTCHAKDEEPRSLQAIRHH